jgi:hypothetical protein
LFNDSVSDRTRSKFFDRSVTRITSRTACGPHSFAGDRSRSEEGFVMPNSVWRNYRTNPHEFDGWIRANAILGAILAIGIVALALGGLYFPGPVDGVTELSSVAAPN